MVSSGASFENIAERAPPRNDAFQHPKSQFGAEPLVVPMWILQA